RRRRRNCGKNRRSGYCRGRESFPSAGSGRMSCFIGRRGRLGFPFDFIREYTLFDTPAPITCLEQERLFQWSSANLDTNTSARPASTSKRTTILWTTGARKHSGKN